MVDPFVTGLDALFGAPGSAAATYIPDAGAPIALRTVKRQRAEAVGLVRKRPTLTGDVFDIRASDVPTPRNGDIIIFAGELYQLVGDPDPDAEGLVWYCEAPRLDRAMTILRRQLQTDEYGDPEDIFAPVGTSPAARRDMGGTEQVEAEQLAAIGDAVLFLPWSDAVAEIDPTARIAEGDTVYSVVSVAEIGTRIGVELVVKRIADEEGAAP